MRRLLAGVVAVAALLCLSACGDDRKCLRSHTDMVWVPIIHSTGKSTYTTMMFVPVEHCDEYAPEPPK